MSKPFQMLICVLLLIEPSSVTSTRGKLYFRDYQSGGSGFIKAQQTRKHAVDGTFASHSGLFETRKQDNKNNSLEH